MQYHLYKYATVVDLKLSIEVHLCGVATPQEKRALPNLTY